MEAAAQTAGGGGGPAPFLLKTYDMVDEASTDDIVSWSDSGASFVVWNPPDLAARLLPTFFKHNNFSSFIRQLNTYGFRKIDPERWEFANADFVRGQKHSLKNIHRRKPIHSHSHPPAAGGGPPDAERAALEEEIDRLTREKDALHADLVRFSQQQPALRDQLEAIGRRLAAMELRQEGMMAFLSRALQSPAFVENLFKMAGAGADPGPLPDPAIDFSAIHKRRRLPPGGESCLDFAEASFFDNHSSTSKPEIGHAFQPDKLKLELSSAMSDCPLASVTTQSESESDEMRARATRARDESERWR